MTGVRPRSLRCRALDALAGLLVIAFVTVMTGAFVVTTLTIYANKRRLDAIEAQIERLRR